MDSKFIEQTQKWFDGGFKAGQQSKQAEIDALKAKIDSALKLMRHPMRGTTSDLLADIEDILG